MRDIIKNLRYWFYYTCYVHIIFLKNIKNIFWHSRKITKSDY